MYQQSLLYPRNKIQGLFFTTEKPHITLKIRILSWLKCNISRLSPLTVLLVFLLAALVYSLYGFEGTLMRDDSIFLYSGQQMADGVPPYVSTFDHKGPMTPLITGTAASIAALLNLDDILVVRITFLLLSSLAVAGLYLLGSKLFSSQKMGLLAAFIFVGFNGFGIHAASGPRPKTPMVVFEILSLLFTARRQWFWAGVCGSLAFLTWQPAGIFILITVLMAFIQSESRRLRLRNTLYAVSGVLIPIAIVSLYFWSQGALYEFIDGALLFNLLYLERVPYTLLFHIIRPIRMVYIGYTFMALPIFLGFFTIFLMYMWRVRLYQSSLLDFIRKDHFAALLLSFAAFVIWSLWDFQGYPDLYVLLPYAALGFGWLLYLVLQNLPEIKESRTILQKVYFLLLCIILLSSAALNYRMRSENGLVEQLQWAQQVEAQYGTDAKLISIGVPQILVLLHRTNPNPYVWINQGVDNKINADTPGGFEGWIEELERYDPDVIVFGRTTGKFIPMLTDWLQSSYRETSVGDWTLFVKEYP